MSPLRQRFFPESRIGGFSRADVMVEFYSRVSALLNSNDRVLDFGAGRGAQIIEDAIPYRRSLKILKGRCARVEGCDVDDEVLTNEYLDAAVRLEPNASLPYHDESFDLIYSNWVFEHIDDPKSVASELLRILKPGGHICAITPNKWGYIALASRLVGNRSHVSFLKRVQPDRKEFDVFPTRYRLNTAAAIRRHFGPKAEIIAYAVPGEPAYHFNRPWIYRAFLWLHALTPSRFQPILLVFIRKT